MKKFGIVILAIVAVFMGYVALQPSDYVISREITINAPASLIFPYLNHSKMAESWAPWMEIDPEATMTYSGPESGVGSRASWDGGKQLGTGSATIVESIPNEKVGINLEYLKPMAMTQYSEYLVRSEGDRSVVTWRVRGKNGFMGRVMCVFFNMDKAVGGMFEKGLSNLKTLMEKAK